MTMAKRKMSFPLLAVATPIALGSMPAAGEPVKIKNGPMLIPAGNAGMSTNLHSASPGWHGGGYKPRSQRTGRGYRVFRAKCRALGLDESTAKRIYEERGAR